MFKDDDVNPQNKSDSDEPILPLPPISPFQPMPVLPIQFFQSDEDKPSAE